MLHETVDSNKCTGLLANLLGPADAAAAQPQCNSGASMNIVAHEDDDLLFLSPDLLHDIKVVVAFARYL